MRVLLLHYTPIKKIISIISDIISVDNLYIKQQFVVNVFKIHPNWR